MLLIRAKMSVTLANQSEHKVNLDYINGLVKLRLHIGKQELADNSFILITYGMTSTDTDSYLIVIYNIKY